MKVRRLLLFPVLCGMFLSSCGGDAPVTPPDNVVTYTFEGLTEDNYLEKLKKDGVRLYVEGFLTEVGFSNVFKDNNLVVPNEKQFKMLCKDINPGQKSVWIRKLEFTFVGNKNQLELVNGDKYQTYEDGVWTTTRTKGNEGDSEINFKAVNEAVISKITVTTAPVKFDTVKIEFTGLDAYDKIYLLKAESYESWLERKLYTPDMDFVTLESYVFWIERSQHHTDYFENATMTYREVDLEEHKVHSPTEGTEYVLYTVTISGDDAEAGKSVINVTWNPKDAKDAISVDITTANKYVKGFMETDPKSFIVNKMPYGKEATVFLNPKKGYKNLKLIVNDQVIEGDEEREEIYKFVVPFAKQITFKFSAEEGEKEEEGKDVIALTGSNKEKGKLLAAEKDGLIYVTFYASEDHPTAAISSLSFKGADLEVVKDDEEGKIFRLSATQSGEYKTTSEEDKPGCFEAVITEQESYKSSVRIKKGDFTVEIAGKEPSIDPTGYIVYEVDGKSDVTIKFTPNEFLDLHSVEVNDKRLEASQYTPNPDGSISYTFNAKAKLYDFLVQTVRQVVRLELDKTSTTGYIVKDLPKEFEVGQKVRLSLGVSSEEYWLEGKLITVTYNETQLTVDETNFTFEIIPLKGVEKIKVVVADKPQA